MDIKENNIVLVGGGHTHLELLRMAKGDQKFLDKVILISDNRYTYYSGMISSWLEGIYTKEESSVDLEAIALRYGIYFINSPVVKIDAKNKQLLLGNEEIIKYEMVSFDIGSTSEKLDEKKINNNQFTVKPFESLSALRRIIESSSSGNIAVVGSGAASLEIALAIGGQNVSNRLVTIVLGSRGLLPRGPNRLRKAFVKRIRRNPKIEIVDQIQFGIEKGIWINEEKSDFYDAVIWATGPRGKNLFKVSQLKVDKNGYLVVNNTLQSITSDSIFAAGDCASIKELELAKNGVNAVRQAPILYNNLKAVIEGKSLQSYIPKKNQLAIFSTGGRTAILHFGWVIWSGKVPWMIKNFIDSGYMKKHKR
ncbi:MAG: FAD-dependent oxidoreductase [Sedimentibacter sp.]